MMPVRALRRCFTALALLAAFSAAAQQLYRWTDEKGRTHVTDTPPPASAKDVRKKDGGSGETQGASGQLPYELTLAMKDFPVVLYSQPTCKQVCSDARALLNKRGVPFKEVVAWDEDAKAELTKISGSVFIPTLIVGRSIQKGYFPDAYNALLDAARYPKAGTAPVRSQAAPPPPKDFVEAPQEAAKAEAVKTEAEEPKGPYSPGAPRQGRTPAKK
jgi:glutaredoxin